MGCYLDVSPEHVLDMLLLEPALDDELVVSVDGPHRPQLGEEEGEQVLGLPVQHLGHLGEVDEGGLLGADAHNLRRPHDELLLLSGHHVGVLVPHDAEHALQQLVVGVVAIRLQPWVRLL